MSDAMVPSYRVQREPSSVPWRLLAVAGGLVGVLAVGAGGWWAFQSLTGSRSVPVVEAPSEPYKVRPDPNNRGGMVVHNQNELILERPSARTQTPAQAGRPREVVPEAEAPNIGGLRAAVAPPPAATQALPPPVVAPNPAHTATAAGAPQRPAAAPATAPAAQGAGQSPQPAQAQPAAAQPAAQPPRPATGRTQVQLGALASEEAARAEWDRLARRAPELFQGRSPQISRLDRGEQPPLFRLRTGGLADQDAAAQFCEQVRARGGACVPVRS